MPKKYLKIRNRCVKRGGSQKRCKAKAARIYNSQRKSGQKAVTTKYK